MGCGKSKSKNNGEKDYYKEIIDTAAWADRAERSRMEISWTSQNIDGCFPGLVRYRIAHGSSFTKSCVQALFATRRTPPSEDEFVEAFKKMIQDSEDTVMNDLGECRLRARLVILNE